MKNDDIISHILENSTLDEIQKELETELNKSYADYDKIAQLTEAISNLKENSLDENHIKENIAKINEKYDTLQKRNRISHIYKWISAISACFIIMLALNTYTMVSFGENIFSAVVEITKSGFLLDFQSGQNGGQPGGAAPETTTANTTPTDTMPSTALPITTITTPATILPATTPVVVVTTEAVTTTKTPNTISPTLQQFQNIGYQITESCREYNIMPAFLDYMTDMTLTDLSTEETEKSTDVYFTFENKNQQLNITIEQYKDFTDIPSVLIPSDIKNHSVIRNSLGEIYIFNTDASVTAIFVYNNAVYTTVGYNINFMDFQNIVADYMEYRES